MSISSLNIRASKKPTNVIVFVSPYWASLSVLRLLLSASPFKNKKNSMLFNRWLYKYLYAYYCIKTTLVSSNLKTRSCILLPVIATCNVSCRNDTFSGSTIIGYLNRFRPMLYQTNNVKAVDNSCYGFRLFWRQWQIVLVLLWNV